MKKFCLIIFLFFVLKNIFAQKEIVLQSHFIAKPDTIWCFLPQNYNETQTFPAVILLHGLTGNYKQWANICNLQNFADKYGFIFLCPDGLFDSWYIDSPLKKNSQYTSFFFTDFLPEMKKSFRIDTTNIFISGLSMGGHGALLFYCLHPEMFKAAGSTSGAVNLCNLYFKKTNIPDLLGDFCNENWKNFSILNQIEKLKNTEKTFIFDCGSEDILHDDNYKLNEVCHKLKIKGKFISRKGNHNAKYWKNSLPAHLEFFNSLIK